MADDFTNLGDIVTALPVRRARALSAREREIVRAGSEIAAQAPASKDIQFQHAFFCQCGLPRKKVIGREFLRKSGKVWVEVQAGRLDGRDGPEEQPVPYGPLPRLVLAYINTYAVRKKTRNIPLGDTARTFLRELGLDTGGRRYRVLHTQMLALAACRITVGYFGVTIHSQPVAKFDAWLATETQAALWRGELELSQDYYDSLVVDEHAVPLDRRALMALRGSALELDIYAWLVHRLYRAKAGEKIWWTPLREQFGGEYRSLRDFKFQFRLALKRVLEAYPDAARAVEVIEGGIRLQPAAPPIPLRNGPIKKRGSSSCV